MNIPYCILKDEKAISRNCFDYHQSLAKRLYNSSKKIKSLNSSNQNPMNNYSKSKIYKWLFSIDLKLRMKICSIHNDWFTKILFQLITYNDYDNGVKFRPRESYEAFYEKIVNETEKIKNNGDDLDKEDYKENFNTFFEGVTPNTNNCSMKNTYKKPIREKDFLKEIRFYNLNTFNDTFTLSFELLKSKTKLQEYFDSISECNIFAKKITSTKINNNSNLFNFSIPNWARKETSSLGLTVHEIIVICFEQIISIYYQIYLLDNVIPKFDIDSKINDFLNMNENIENYLGKEINNDDIFDINKITNQINAQEDLIKYYEMKSENVYIIAFDRNRSQFYFDKDGNEREISITISGLKKDLSNNIAKFVNKISLVDNDSAFKIQNIIYNVIYQDLSTLCSKRNIDELCMNCINIDEDENKPKNKKRKRKNKKNNTENNKNENNDKKNEINYNINTNIDKKYPKEIIVNNEKENDNDNDNEYNNINNNYIRINNVDNRNNINNNSDEDEENIFSNDCYDKYQGNIGIINRGEKKEKEKVEYIIEMKELNENGKEIKKEENEENEEKEKEINGNDLLKELIIMKIRIKK